MATPVQILEVRTNTQEYANVEPFTDDFIGELIDGYGVTGAEYRIWIAKRNTVAALVDISEGGSSRKNSQVFDQYSKIVAGYEQEEVPTDGRRPPMTREITRG